MNALRVLPFLVAVLFLAGVATPSVAPPQVDEPREDEGVERIRGLHIDPLSQSESPAKSTTRAEQVDTSEGASSEELVNPWGNRRITVAISGEPADWTAGQASAVEEAIRFWNRHHGTYTDAAVEFVFAPNFSRPDVTVQYVSYIETCDGYENAGITLACAPRYDDGETATSPTTVRVRDGRSTDQLKESVKHEFGHLLGLRHGEEPMPLMRSRTDFEPKPSVLNASSRENPWHKNYLSVAVTQDGTYSQGVLQAHVREALQFYETGSQTWDGPSPEFRIVDDPGQADIVLEVTRDDACEIGGGYCWTVSGEQLDRDAALEYYTKFEATFGNLDSRYLSWYAGRVLGYALGAESESELPETFVEPRNADETWFDQETRDGERRAGPNRGPIQGDDAAGYPNASSDSTSGAT